MEDLQIAINFVKGNIPVEEFMGRAIVDASLFETLQTLIPPGTTRCVQKIIGGKLITQSVTYDIKEYCTELYATGTLDARVNIFAAVRDVVLSNYPNITVDQSLIEKFVFILNHTPNYIGGVDAEKVLEQIYDSMGKAKPKIYKEIVKHTFICANKPPRWIQAPEWPVNAKGEPFHFLYEKKLSSEEKEYLFKEVDGDQIISIKQSY